MGTRESYRTCMWWKGSNSQPITILYRFVYSQFIHTDVNGSLCLTVKVQKLFSTLARDGKLELPQLRYTQIRL